MNLSVSHKSRGSQFSNHRFSRRKACLVGSPNPNETSKTFEQYQGSYSVDCSDFEPFMVK